MGLNPGGRMLFIGLPAVSEPWGKVLDICAENNYRAGPGGAAGFVRTRVGPNLLHYLLLNPKRAVEWRGRAKMAYCA